MGGKTFKGIDCSALVQVCLIKIIGFAQGTREIKKNF